MINMQSAFLIVSKQYTEKQAGILFFGKCFLRTSKVNFLPLSLIHLRVLAPQCLE